MDKIRNITESMLLELKKWPLVLMNLNRFFKEVNEKEINWIQFGMLIMWGFIAKYWKESRSSGLCMAMEMLASVVLMSIYLFILVIIGNGERDIKVIFNLSVYVHFFYVLLSIGYHIKPLLFPVFVIGHFYVFSIHYYGLIKWLKCSRKRLYLVTVIELSIVIMGAINTLMVYTGEYMLYSTRILYYPYIG